MTADPQTDRDALAKDWNTYTDLAHEITRRTVRLFATRIREEHPDTVKVKIVWEEAAEFYLAGPNGYPTDGAYETPLWEMDEGLAEELAGDVPHIWETSPYLLERYTVSGEVNVERHTYTLSLAELDIELMLNGPRTPLEQSDLVEALLEARRAER